MRYLVYGAGGIGGPLGVFLHDAGRDVVLIARGAHLERIQALGLTVVTPDGERTVRLPAVRHPEEIDLRPSDTVLLTMKAQDTEPALQALRDAGADPWETAVFCVQNCITNEPAAVRYFRRVYGVMIVIPGIYLEPGVVHNPIGGNHGYMDVGCFPRGTDALAEQFVADARAAGYAATLHEDVMAAKGAKFLGNLVNALEAITDAQGDLEPFVERCREEARACLAAAGLPLEGESYLARVRANRGTNAETGVPKRSSSWQSLHRRQGSIEADFLNGEVVRLGRIHGIATPYNAVLQRVATEMARLRQAPGRHTVEELTAMAEGGA